MFNLTGTQLRFACEATTALRLETANFRAGSNLRGALGQVMTRSYCAHTPTPAPLPRLGGGDGGGRCPVCWLLAANERPGQERRGYAIVPPYNSHGPDVLQPGERFEFGITLFGQALKFLPYFILAVPETGRLGLGPSRGKFALKSVSAEDPFSRARECLLAEGDNLVHTPTITVTHEQVLARASSLFDAIRAREGRLAVRFLTPTRLVDDGHLVQAPLFDALMDRLLKRLDELAEQFSDSAPRGSEAAASLHQLAARVRLIEQETRWVEAWSGSQRRGKPSPISGIVGRATYAASPDTWQPLLPWLLWGQLTQVGKSTVKGNGVITVV